MSENNENMNKAYTELIEILKHLPEEAISKIPSYLIVSYESKKDLNYHFEFDSDKDFEDQHLFPETTELLAELYKNYWASEEEKKDLIINSNLKDQNIKDDVYKLMRNSNIVANSYQNETVHSIVAEAKKKDDALLPTVIKKENIFTRLINFLKKIFINPENLK